jgi:hypothetical protein
VLLLFESFERASVVESQLRGQTNAMPKGFQTRLGYKRFSLAASRSRLAEYQGARVARRIVVIPML